MTAVLIPNEREATAEEDRPQASGQPATSAREHRKRLRLLRKQLRGERSLYRTTSNPRPHESPQLLLAGSFGSRII